MDQGPFALSRRSALGVPLSHRAPTSLGLRGTIGPTKEFYGIRVVAQT